MEEYTPFGIRFKDNQCHIKLRFHPKKWEILGINKYMDESFRTDMSYRTTQNGYILFEALLDTKSLIYKEIRNKLNTVPK